MAEGGSDFPEDERDAPFSDNSANLISFDSEEMVNMVNDQTEDIVTSCLHEMYRTSGNPMTPELQNIFPDPQSDAVEVGRDLAQIGDAINERFSGGLRAMAARLSMGEQTSYEMFRDIIQGLFADGEINWGRIVALICLTARIILTVADNRVERFLQNGRPIIRFAVRVIRSEFSRWIANQGGWRSALQLLEHEWNWRFCIWVVAGITTGCVAFYFILKKK